MPAPAPSDPPAGSVAAAVGEVRERIAGACDRSGRRPADVTLLAVTKYADVEAVGRLVDAGITDLGENQAQRLRDRAPGFPDIRWHAIGPLQVNKAKYVARFADQFHALDRLPVAEALSTHRLAAGRRPLECFVQVNLAGEATKAGVATGDLDRLVRDLRQAELPGVSLVGLMAMPPLPAIPEDSRAWFRELASRGEGLGLGKLSMGTSADFEVAVEEGATVVRVGTTLLR